MYKTRSPATRIANKFQENDMNWEDELRRQLNDEKRSISSESSGEGVHTVSQGIQISQSRDDPPDLWDTSELENSLRELPGSDQIEETIKTNNSNLNLTSRNQADTALLYAIWYGNKEYVLRLLDEFGSDPNCADFKGRTALHYSCIIGDANITRILLRHHALSHQWDKQHTVTPLHCAAS